jgi:hypothetical protein
MSLCVPPHACTLVFSPHVCPFLGPSLSYPSPQPRPFPGKRLADAVEALLAAAYMGGVATDLDNGTAAAGATAVASTSGGTLVAEELLLRLVSRTGLRDAAWLCQVLGVLPTGEWCHSGDPGAGIGREGVLLCCSSHVTASNCLHGFCGTLSMMATVALSHFLPSVCPFLPPVPGPPPAGGAPPPPPPAYG